MVNRPIQGLSPRQKEMQADKNEADFKLQTNQRLQSFERSLAEVHRRITDNTSAQGVLEIKCKIAQENYSQHISSEIAKFAAHLVDQRRAIDVMMRYVKEQLDKQAELFAPNDKVAEASQSIQSSVAKMEMDYQQFKSEINALIHKISTDFDAKLSAFKEEILSRPSDIPAVKKELHDKIDLVALDGTNSILRTTNCEKQLMLIEKKIEQIYLLIKKLELSRQE